MSAAERDELDTDPLWSDQGQVLWFLEGREDGQLLPVSTIAAELRLQRSAATAALRELRKQGKVSYKPTRKAGLWGSSSQVRRPIGSERQTPATTVASMSIAERNQELRRIRDKLRQTLAALDRAVAVTSLTQIFPAPSPEPRTDSILLCVANPRDALWLLGRIEQSDPE